MPAAAPSRLPKPKPARRPRRKRTVYRVRILPGGDPSRGEELIIRWLADLLAG